MTTFTSEKALVVERLRATAPGADLTARDFWTLLLDETTSDQEKESREGCGVSGTILFLYTPCFSIGNE